MDETSRRDRGYGAVVGQAVGDALGAPTEGMTPLQISDRYGWIDDFVSDDPAGTDDSEYAVFTAWNLLEYGEDLTTADVGAEWRRVVVAQVGGFYGGGFSEMNGINNLRRGLEAPQAGNDNHELWSDGTAMRVAPIGVFCAGDPEEAARLAAIDASVSHARDGVYCGQAVAAAVAVAVVADDWRDVAEAGLAATPRDSWSARLIRRAIEIGSGYDSVRAALPELHDAIAVDYYPWTDVGPEATALAFGVFSAARGEYLDSVLGGVNIGRDADTIAAMAGGMAGGLHGASAVPQRWSEQVRIIRGQCITATAGADLRDLADRLVASAESRGNK